jgi:hypothetical protein
MAYYYGLPSSLKQKIQVVQNKMARFILNLNPRHHIGQTQIRDAGLSLKIKDRVTQLSMNMVYNVFHIDCPEYMKSFFTRTNQIHNHPTRASSYNFYQPSTGSTIMLKTFHHNAIIEWNSLPIGLKNSTTKFTFRREIKSFLSHRAFKKESNPFTTNH